MAGPAVILVPAIRVFRATAHLIIEGYDRRKVYGW
jgi:hypothetical protein